jgi:hypothetical protein
VYIHEEGLFGTAEQLGAFASVIKYNKNGFELEELIENDEFAIMDEIVFEHIEEEN